MSAGFFKDGMGVTDGAIKCHGVRGTGANVEADANDLKAKLLCEGEKAVGGVHGSTKLHTETAQARGVVRHDAEEQLGAREELGDLVKLVCVVKGHLLDASSLDIADV